ncbi:Gfo/Idh/MocA family protein [Halococcoides cellulosivorans]|uniref:Oxidoreductase n=1 Tax=Halococcoides cellulosivorans TaxID=1679096 RepID=A0A2R4X2H5_9EURY|nr:Gfo/Idh/MocA family oxidoreductase [Halococcoides cellulosivorans]AWB27974.1 oxidoreductase [Halococcoides cellulosivorans]
MSLTVGFLGAGFMGRAHTHALTRLPLTDDRRVERAILLGRDADRTAAAAEHLGFDRATTDRAEAVTACDVFYVLGPNDVHAEASVAALDAGCDVLCEKPLARSATEADRMVAAAEDSDAVTATGFNYRWVPALRYARELIGSGEIGTVRRFRGRYLQNWLLDPDAPWSWRCSADRAGSGALGDLGAHVIDLARWLVGEIAVVDGETTTHVDHRPAPGGTDQRPVTVDDHVSAELAFEDGATGQIECSRVEPGRANDLTVEIVGSEGSIRFSLPRLNELELVDADESGVRRVDVTGPDTPGGERWWPPGHVLGWDHTFVAENAAFLDAVSEREGYTPDFATGRAVQRVLDAIQASAKAGERRSVHSESRRD